MAGDAALKLKATDEEDMAIISAMLQDALVPVSEIAWTPAESQFVLVANRFRWEADPERDRRGSIRARVHSGLCVDHVAKVRRRGFDRGARSWMLALLAIRHETGEAGHTLDLMFSGGAEIRLEVTALACRLEDLDQPWPTRATPAHDRENRGR